MGRHGDRAPTDETLAVRARAGDETAFQALFDRHRHRLERLARRRLPRVLRRRVSASDVVQECYATAFQRLESLVTRDEDAFRRWIQTILGYKIREEIRNHLRREKRRANREVPPEERPATAAFAGGLPTPSVAAARQEDRVDVLTAIGTLRPDDRTVLRLVHDAGMTIPEAAEEMGRTAMATRKLYSRAVARLAAVVRSRREETSRS